MSSQAATDELPSFLYGTFDWLINGIVIEKPASFDLCSQAGLEHDNPWVVVASIMEHAKVGYHEHVPALERFFESSVFALDRVALLIAGMTVSSADVALIEKPLQSARSETRVFAAAAAREVGYLRIVPAMLEAWRRAEHHRQRASIAQCICDLLEAPDGPLLAESAFYNPIPVDPSTLDNPKVRAFAAERNSREPVEEKFPSMVLSRCTELSERFGSSDVCLWAGALRHPHQVARACLEALPDAHTSLDLIHYRRVFEATTAVSCGEFFEWDRLQRLSIQVILHDFLQTPATGFREGLRYFWGHIVP